MRKHGIWAAAVLMAAGLAAVPKTNAAPPARRQWKNGPPSDASYFPIAVWLQSPGNAAKYKAAGINLYVGLWQGPTDAQLTALAAAGMPVICEQNAVGLAHRQDSTIVGWMHGDEPDNAQPVTDPKTGKTGYGPFIPPARIVADYKTLQAADPTRPILLNLGQGVANDEWNGRGPGAKLTDYETFVQGGDIVSFDVYPVAGIGRPDGADYLWYVPKGVDRLMQWTKGRRQVWNCIECTAIDGGKKATPAQVRAEVWMSLIHGSRGLIYFVHQFKPAFNEHALLDDPPMLAQVTATNKQIHALAPILNSPDVKEGATVASSSPQAPISLTTRRHGGSTYVFAVGMRNAPAQASFQVKNVPVHATAQVLGESRALPVRGGRFTDAFAPYAVHLYRITGRS